MLKKKLILLGVFAALIGLICIAALFQSDDLKVSRSRLIKAAPASVFKVVNDFRQWDAWSPWSKLDPQMTKRLEGPAEGVGAVYHWSGNNEVGEGSTRLTESKASERIGMKLEFVRPFPGTSDVEFTLVPEAEGTRVTWTMTSKKPFIGKVMGMFIDCEKMCGDQFNEGLDNLAKVTTATPAK